MRGLCREVKLGKKSKSVVHETMREPCGTVICHNWSSFNYGTVCSLSEFVKRLKKKIHGNKLKYSGLETGHWKLPSTFLDGKLGWWSFYV